MGAGADLFAACTHRLVMPGTSFAFPGARGFGLVLGTRRLAHRVGAAQAQDWVVNGSAISTEAALRSGLATDETTGEIDIFADRAGDPRPERDLRPEHEPEIGLDALADD